MMLTLRNIALYVLLTLSVLRCCFTAKQKTHFETLGVSRSASTDTIKQSYRTLAKKYHPDKNKNNPNAEKMFIQVSQAYEVLSDNKKRKEYEYSLQENDYGRRTSGYSRNHFQRQQQQEEVVRMYRSPDGRTYYQSTSYHARPTHYSNHYQYSRGGNGYGFSYSFESGGNTPLSTLQFFNVLFWSLLFPVIVPLAMVGCCLSMLINTIKTILVEPDAARKRDAEQFRRQMYGPSVARQPAKSAANTSSTNSTSTTVTNNASVRSLDWEDIQAQRRSVVCIVALDSPALAAILRIASKFRNDPVLFGSMIQMSPQTEQTMSEVALLLKKPISSEGIEGVSCSSTSDNKRDDVKTMYNILAFAKSGSKCMGLHLPRQMSQIASTDGVVKDNIDNSDYLQLQQTQPSVESIASGTSSAIHSNLVENWLLKILDGTETWIHVSAK